jgi:arginyl-tRNA synthetase
MGFLPQPVITALKEILEQALESALSQLVRDGVVPGDHGVEVRLTRTREREHGDFAANLAMQLARPARRKPREIAERLQAAFPTVPGLAAVEIAGPGFINFRLEESARFAVLQAIAAAGPDYGRSDIGRGQTVQVEFVSANPTGPLHVGHGRGAAYGATVADLLAFCGFEVTREYYVNDAGRQMNILAASVWVRYLEKRGSYSPSPPTATAAATSTTSPTICPCCWATPAHTRRNRCCRASRPTNRTGATRRPISMPW